MLTGRIEECFFVSMIIHTRICTAWLNKINRISNAAFADYASEAALNNSELIDRVIESPYIGLRPRTSLCSVNT